MANWLDKYEQGGLVLKQKTKDNYGKKPNANNSDVSLPPGFKGWAYNTKGRNYSPAWGGQFQDGGNIMPAMAGANQTVPMAQLGDSVKPIPMQLAMGGSLPGAVGFTYARTAGAAPANGPYAKKTKASAQNGQEMKYYQAGLDFTPKTISKNGGWLDKFDTPQAQDGDVLEYLKKTKSAPVVTKGKPLTAEQQKRITAETLNRQTQKNKPLTATNTRPIAEAKARKEQLDVVEKNKEADRRLQAERAAARKTREAVIGGDENATFTFPDGTTKSWKNMDWREQQYVSGKNLGSLNRGDWTDYINPLAMIGSMGEGLATSPYEARRTNSMLPYVTGVGAPLLTGALAGTGAKSVGQFAENIVSPIPVKLSGIRGYKSVKGSKNNFYDLLESPYYNELLETDPIHARSIKEQVSSGNKWLKDWISHPETQKRMSALQFNKNPKVQQNIQDFISGKNVVQGKVDFDIHNPTFTGEQLGMYQPSKNRAYIDLMHPAFFEGKSIPSTTIHEGTHLISRGDLAYGQKANNLVKKIFADDDFMYDLTKMSAGRSRMFDPLETHARIMQLRNKYNIKPDEKVTDALTNKIIEDGISNKTQVDPSFFKNIINRKAFNEAFNKLPAAVPAVGAASMLGGESEESTKKGFQDGGDIPVDPMGYWNPDNWGNPVIIPSTDITMEGVDQPLIGISDTGDVQYMEPGEDYEFDGEYVTEYPVAQRGKKVYSSKDIKAKPPYPEYPEDDPRRHGLFNKYSKERVPIYVDNPNDPRLKNYQDSLRLYKAMVMQDKLMGPASGPSPFKIDWTTRALKEGRTDKIQKGLEELGPMSEDFKSEKEQFAEGYNSWTSRKEDKKLINYYRSLGFTDKDIMFHSSPDVVSDRIKAIGTYYDGTANSPIYKKPVQPVEYGKPEPEKVKELPVAIIKPGKKPKPVPTDYFQGQSVFAPTPYHGSGAGAFVGYKTPQGDTVFVKPEDYERMGVPKYGREFIESKKKQRNGGVNNADAQPIEKLDQLLNFTNYNKPTKGGWLDKYN